MSRASHLLSNFPSGNHVINSRMQTKFYFLAVALSLMSATLTTAAETNLAAAATPVDQLKVLKDFRVELLHTVPKADQGSWVAMTVDPKGRLIVSDQYGKLYRVVVPPIASADAPKISTIDAPIGQAQGLLYAFDSLYVMVANEGFQGRGLYRVKDTDGDDQFDEVKLLRKLD